MTLPIPLLIALLLFALAGAIVGYAYRHAPLEVREDTGEYDNE